MRRRYRGPLVGLVFGIASLIAVITLGDLIQKTIGRNLTVIGSALLVKANLNPTSYDYPDDTWYFNDYDVMRIEEIPSVTTVSRCVYSWWPKRLRFDAWARRKTYHNIYVMGVDAAFFRLTAHLPMAQGRTLVEDDVVKVRNVCVIGRDVRQFFFEEGDSAIGQILILSGNPLEIVGVLDSADDVRLNSVALIPLTVATKKFAGLNAVRRLTVLPEDVYSIERVQKQVNAILSQSKGKRAAVYFDAARVRAIRDILDVFDLFVRIGVIVVLLLSAVGVANVMFAMVRERTSEIGLRKAVGATNGDITAQFLMESVFVTVIGAIIGTVIGSIIVVCIAFLALHSSIEFEMLLLAAAVALLTGIVSGVASGVLPARSAAKLDTVAALRFE